MDLRNIMVVLIATVLTALALRKSLAVTLFLARMAVEVGCIAARLTTMLKYASPARDRALALPLPSSWVLGSPHESFLACGE